MTTTLTLDSKYVTVLEALGNVEDAHLLPDSCDRMIIPRAVEQEI